ncbi:acetylglutamate kinase-like protein, partial [mine drainage metagenome]
ELVDFGFVGDIDVVDPMVLRKLLDSNLMPVVSPLSADDEGTLLNINADTVAAALAAALGAEKLVLCTGAPGILADRADPGSLISYTDLAGLRELRERGGHCRGHAAEGQGHRSSHSRRGAPRPRGVVPVAGGHPRRGVHQRGDRHADRRGRHCADAGRAAGCGELSV